MFEDLDEADLTLGRRVLAAVGWRVGMVTVLLDDSGQLPGPTIDSEDFDEVHAVPDVRSPWTQRALLDLVREQYEDGLMRIEPARGGYAIVGYGQALPCPETGWPTPARALVAALDPDGEPEPVPAEEE